MNDKYLKIQIRRETNGQVYSEVIDLNSINGVNNSRLVIDRQNGRHIDLETIRLRAELLSLLTGIEIDEDLEWPCAAKQKMKCRCPKCIKAGR